MASKTSSGDGLAIGLIIIWVAVVIGCALGWIMNIVKLFSMLNDPITAMEIMRGIGIIAAPLGVVLGYL